MTLLTILHIINISVIWALVIHLTLKIYNMKYGVYWSIMRMIRHRDYRGMNWLANNWHYFLHIGFAITLTFINITLIGQLINSSLLSKPIFTFVLYPIGWCFVFLYIWSTPHKVKS